MKTLAVIFFLLLASTAAAQEPDQAAVRDGAWELGIFGGGGRNTWRTPDIQFAFAGGRVGRVLTDDHLPGWMRGNFELAGEFMPVLEVYTQGKSVYGASFKPLILQWNFTKCRRVVPYFHMAGGLLFSTSNLPPGNTSAVNFTPQGGAGAHWFVKQNRSVDFACDIVHISNASLGTQNPGYNFSLLFSVGYTWFKSPLRHRAKD